MSREWFAYTGPIGGELSAANYLFTPVSPTCFEGTQNISAVYGLYQPIPYGQHPVPFSNNILTYIAAAKATTSSQPIGFNGVQKYVYTYPGL